MPRSSSRRTSPASVWRGGGAATWRSARTPETVTRSPVRSPGRSPPPACASPDAPSPSAARSRKWPSKTMAEHSAASTTAPSAPARSTRTRSTRAAAIWLASARRQIRP